MDRIMRSQPVLCDVLWKHGKVSVWTGVKKPHVFCRASFVAAAGRIKNNINSIARSPKTTNHYSIDFTSWICSFSLLVFQPCNPLLLIASPWNITDLVDILRCSSLGSPPLGGVSHPKACFCWNSWIPSSKHFQKSTFEFIKLYNFTNQKRKNPQMFSCLSWKHLPQNDSPALKNPRKDPEERWPGTSRRASCATTRRWGHTAIRRVGSIRWWWWSHTLMERFDVFFCLSLFSSILDDRYTTETYQVGMMAEFVCHHPS